MIKKGEFQQKLKTAANNYIKFIKWPICFGAGTGFLFGTAYSLDEINRHGTLSNVEKLGYPIGGTIVGAGFGATFPIWLIFAPVTFIFGSGFTGDIAKIIFAYLIFATDSSHDVDKKNK
jgi:hypothetical protein